ncbi:GntP family permease [Brevibacterium moorei]|uniref:GntP family permease n=1 Tax=Brevibacterium moorei TaxID=2968457 RepID=UPI00211CC198|nr:GntP family permease [Brevibacterium sp. 68QC2CO]MCQ9385684.1 GntP family permease [Brevibacterium sp. 68QC2CO]
MDVQLLIALVLGIATIVILVLRTRLDAFVALLIAAMVTGVVAGQPVVELIKSITSGFGSTLASTGIVIGLGVGIGKILEVSGGADALARAFLKAFGKGREPWAMGTVGSLVSIPVFCDSGFVIMNPLARSIARVKRGGYVTLALALGCGMTLTHHMVPPTPGPLAVAGLLGTDLGSLILTGLIFTVILLPVVVSYAKFIGPKLEPRLNKEVALDVYGPDYAQTIDAHVVRSGKSTKSRKTAGTSTPATGDGDATAAVVTYDPEQFLGTTPAGKKPHKTNAWLGALPLFVPLLLIVVNTVTAAIDKSQQNALSGDDYTPSAWVQPFTFLGDPVVALIIGMILAVYVLLPRWTPRTKVHGWLSEGAASAGLILLITGAGGGLGQVLRDSGVGDALAQAVASTPLPAFLVPFIIATVVRVAQGSGTVAMITAASVTAPLVGTLGVSPLIAAMACVCGSMVFSYFNDSYFWVVTRFTGLDGIDAMKGWSGITTCVWAASIPLLIVANLLVG